MINFRLPNWVIFTALFTNMWLICFSLIFGDFVSVLLGVFCMCCFIFTYKLNQWERDEKEKEQKDDKGSSLR
tara:strand:- start:19 stop:234 length:216 start_codon:yes stop_codon:yes gene_type:complete